MAIKKMKFEGHLEDPLSPHNGKRQVKTMGHPECQDCGCDIAEGQVFWFTSEKKKVYCQDCEDSAEKQLEAETKSTRNGVARRTPVFLLEVKD